MAGKLKINNDQSAFKKDPNAKKELSFEERAKNSENKHNDLNLKTFELANQFFAALVDRTLLINKHEINKKIEEDIIRKLQKLSLELNEHSDQPEGMGSVMIEGMILSSMFKLRNRLNDLEFRLTELEKNKAEKS